MADKIKVGLLGYGYASKTFHAPLIMGTPGLELAGVSAVMPVKCMPIGLQYR